MLPITNYGKIEADIVHNLLCTDPYFRITYFLRSIMWSLSFTLTRIPQNVTLAIFTRALPLSATAGLDADVKAEGNLHEIPSLQERSAESYVLLYIDLRAFTKTKPVALTSPMQLCRPAQSPYSPRIAPSLSVDNCIHPFSATSSINLQCCLTSRKRFGGQLGWAFQLRKPGTRMFVRPLVGHNAGVASSHLAASPLVDNARCEIDVCPTVGDSIIE